MDLWVKLVRACTIARQPQNVLYRLAAVGEIATRPGAGDRLEFRVRDLERLGRKRASVKSPTAA